MAVIAASRMILRRQLSPEAFRLLRSCWWHTHFYLPHLAASIVVRRTPTLRAFPDDRSSELLRRLRGINVFAPTDMCRVMTKHGSDKGQGWHNYTAIYAVLFAEFRDRPLRIFELGLGTNNPRFAFNMGLYGEPGASLRGWRELFPLALVYGADIDRGILFQEDRIKTFYCDQLDALAISDLWSQPDLQGGMDIIIDDGLHTFEANTLFLDGSLGQLNAGGIYVIEDIYREKIESWMHHLRTTYSKLWPDYEFALAELPNPSNTQDNNNLLIIRRRL